MKQNWDTKAAQELFTAVTALQTERETRQFLRDLLTPAEIIEFSNRWTAARMLAERESYVAIQEKTGLSSATVARISVWLKRGMGGYRFMIARLHHHGYPLAGRGR